MGYNASAKYYDLFGEKPDIEYYKSLGILHGEALEIGVGTARVALELAKAEVNVWGMDNSSEMLEIARKKIASQPEEVQRNIRIIQKDMTDFDISRSFPLVYIPSSGFSHCVSREDQLNCLRCIHDHLDDDGCFAFDLALPSTDYSSGLKLIDEKKMNDCTVLRWIAHRPDYVNQVLDTTLVFEVYKDNNLTEKIVESSTVSLIYKRELLYLLEKAHFVVDYMYGDFSKSETITWQIVVEASKSKV